jgi:cell volume regulation protein A
MFSADRILLLLSSTLLIAYISNLFYTKTKIPDIIWVLAFGIALGPVLGYFDKTVFLELAPLMSTVALSIILFEAGINVDIKLLVGSLRKATLLSVATILSVMLTVGFSLSTFMPSSFTLLQAMLLGAMIGGTSTIAVFGVLSGLDKIVPDIEGTRTLLMLESVVSDPICIISSVTLIRMIMMPGVSIIAGLSDILRTFILSSLLGFVMGQLWAEALDKLRGRSLNYIMTLAILFPVYILAERVIGEGGGPMSTLTFGIMITNYGYIARRLGLVRNVKIDIRYLREVHEEITFFIKAFFFVFVGLIVTLSAEYAVIGMGVLALIMLIRLIVVSVVGRVENFSRQERVLSILIYASGLPAFVMSQLPLIYDPGREFFLDPAVYPNLVMPIVLGTVLFAAVSAPILSKRLLQE